jgi:hypothetical protein
MSTSIIKNKMKKEEQKQPKEIQNSELNNTNTGSKNYRQYQSIEEGKKHYARLSNQNNWMKEEEKNQDEQAEIKRLEDLKADKAKEFNE